MKPSDRLVQTLVPCLSLIGCTAGSPREGVFNNLTDNAEAWRLIGRHGRIVSG